MTAMADDGFWEQPMKVLVDALGQAPPAGGGARTPLEGDPGERGRRVGFGEPTTGSGTIRRGVSRERTERGGGGAAYGEGSHR